MENCLICLEQCEMPYYKCPQCSQCFHAKCYDDFLKTTKKLLENATCCHCSCEFYKFTHVCDSITAHGYHDLETYRDKFLELAQKFDELAKHDYKIKFLEMCDKYNKLKDVINDYFRAAREIQRIVE